MANRNRGSAAFERAMEIREAVANPIETLTARFAMVGYAAAPQQS